MIGVAVGLGNVWRFPYMVGEFGGASFVLVYVLLTLLVGLPALIAEWALGRSTRRGPAGALQIAGLPGGRVLGWVLFGVITIAAGYYNNAIGWVLYTTVGQAAHLVGLPWKEGAVLPPDSGLDVQSLTLQLICTGSVLAGLIVVVIRGLRSGIERVSKIFMPILFISLVILIARSLTLEGAEAGVAWYILKFEVAAWTPTVLLAAMGQVFFSLSLGGTFMVVYGSYLERKENLGRMAIWTAAGDLCAGLLAGLAIFPAVFAFGLEPQSGPGLLFFTLPNVFGEMPFGAVFGLVFFAGLLSAGFLSGLAAFEVAVASLIDNTSLTRRSAAWLLGGAIYLVAIPPMINMEIFVPWDLTFGAGMQAFGSLLAVLAFAWTLKRAKALRELGGGMRWLYLWLRFAVPAAILAIGVWWLLTEALGVVSVD